MPPSPPSHCPLLPHQLVTSQWLPFALRIKGKTLDCSCTTSCCLPLQPCPHLLSAPDTGIWFNSLRGCAPSCLRAFACTVPSAPTALPPDTTWPPLISFRSFLQSHHLSEAFLASPTKTLLSPALLCFILLSIHYLTCSGSYRLIWSIISLPDWTVSPRAGILCVYHVPQNREWCLAHCGCALNSCWVKVCIALGERLHVHRGQDKMVPCGKSSLLPWQKGPSSGAKEPLPQSHLGNQPVSGG